jgi:hypothetical protein
MIKKVTKNENEIEMKTNGENHENAFKMDLAPFQKHTSKPVFLKHQY